MRLDRITPKERHPRSAGTQPRASREQCAVASWGGVRPFASSTGGYPSVRGGGRVIVDGMDQRGRTGVGDAVV